MLPGLFMSCNEDSILDTSSTIPNEIPQQRAELRALSFDVSSVTNPTLHDDWENPNLTTLRLNDDSEVIVPWNSGTGTSIDIPKAQVQDIKKEDGWLLSHNMLTINNEPNFMFFYNKRRGVLKVFYYNKTNILNQSLIWVVESNTPTSILPSNTLIQGVINTNNQYATTSNLLNNSITNFGQLVQGWNMFMLELPYGQINNNPILNIRSYNNLGSTIELGGDFSGDIAITIPQSSPSFFSSLLSILGDIPKFTNPDNWIDKIYNVRDGVTALGKLGSSSLFTSSSGDKIVKGTTAGKITLTGREFSNSSGATTPFTGLDLKHINGNKNLGVWSMKETPTFSYNKYSLCGLDRNRTYSYPLELRYTGNDNNNMIVINPDVRDEIKSYAVSINSFFTIQEPYRYKYTKITNEVHDLENLLYNHITIYGSEPYIDPENGSYPTPFGFIMVAEHIITSDIYANVSVIFTYHDGSTYTSTRNYKINTVPYDNYTDAMNKTRPYSRVEYITVW